MAMPYPARRIIVSSFMLSPNAITDLFLIPSSHASSCRNSPLPVSNGMISKKYGLLVNRTARVPNRFLNSGSTAAIMSGSAGMSSLYTGLVRKISR